MPKVARELSATEVRRLTKPGLHAVGGVTGLYLQVTNSGARSWILRATVGAKRRDIGLGGFPDVTLSQARERAREAKDKIRQGLDPVAERRAARAALEAAHAKDMTFKEAAEEFLRSKRSEFKNEKHAKQWESTLETYAYPVLGKMLVDQIELAHVVKVLEPIWQTKTETATRLRGRIESVLAWAIVHGHRDGANVAIWKGNLEAVLPKPRKLSKVTHFRALPYVGLPDFLTELRKREGMAARAVEFAILTAARSGEVRGAAWAEVDLDEAVWTIPADRMKAGQEHRVPLSDAAVDLLKALPRFEGQDLIFPAPKGGPLSDMTLTAVLRRMEVDATVHGFRSTFSDWAYELTAYQREVIEKSLAHTIGDKVEAAYRRGELFEKRRRLMDDWAAYAEHGKLPESAEVVSIKAGAA